MASRNASIQVLLSRARLPIIGASLIKHLPRPPSIIFNNASTLAQLLSEDGRGMHKTFSTADEAGAAKNRG